MQEFGEDWKSPIPPPEELANMASLETVDEDHLRLLYSRATPQPFGTVRCDIAHCLPRTRATDGARVLLCEEAKNVSSLPMALALPTLRRGDG